MTAASLLVYVAGSSAEIERAERVIAKLRDLGCTITHDWTAEVREARAAGHATDADLSDHRARALAESDMAAVLGCEVFLFLAPETPTRGAWVELGAAVGRNVAWTIVSGPQARASIFTRLADELYETDDEAIAACLEEIQP